jgi:hypothetical protein
MKSTATGGGQRRRLKGEDAEADPAVRVMRVAHEKRGEQREHGKAHHREDDVGAVEPAVVDLHQPCHGGQTQDRVDRLAKKKCVRRAIADFGQYRRSAEDHQQADDDENQRCAEE